MHRKFWHRAVCVLSCAVLAGGCGKKRVQTVADGPALTMPPPPSRVFAPIEDEEPLAAERVPDAPVRLPAVNPTTKPAAKPKPAEAERTEQAPPAPATAAPEPPRELRAASSPADPESEKKIGELLKRASSTLGNVYYQGLSTGRRENYEQAKAFITEAEKALKERNYLYAETLADKAGKLATELLGR
jgi:type IV secretory pathway VirB10-like protein